MDKPVDINKYLSWERGYDIITIHPLFNDIQEVIEKNGEIISGPDTALAWYQIYRTQKDWKNADRVKIIIEDMGFTPAFTGKRYEVRESVWTQKYNNKK